jgi:hypothetical protein
VTFDEFNGSQVEQVDELRVGKEILAEKSIKRKAIGEVKPQEEDEDDCEIIEESPNTPPTAYPGESGENPETHGFPETPEKILETPDFPLVTLKVDKNMRI